MPTSTHDSEVGLSLVEMLLVLGILAMASGLVFARGLPGAERLERAALVAFFSDARAAAMLSGDTVTVQVEGGDLRVIRSGTVIAHYRPSGAFVAVSSVRFRSDGTSPGGSFILAEGPGMFRVDIAAPTGRITTSY